MAIAVKIAGNSGSIPPSGTVGLSTLAPLAANTVIGNSTAASATPTATTVKQTYQFVYNFAVLGGAMATIPLTPITTILPINFIIQNSFIDTVTILGSGGAALAAVTTGQGANDLVVATVIAGAPFSTTGVKVTIPLIGTIATWIKTTAARTPAIVISGATVTSGKFNLFIEGWISS